VSGVVPRADGGRRRVTVIVLTFTVTLVAVAAVVVPRTWTPAIRAGLLLSPYRAMVARVDASDSPVDVVWFGDSTIFSTAKHRSYVDETTRTLLAPLGLHTLNVASPGLDFFAYYPLVAHMLERRPRLIVLIVNFRLFAAKGLAPYGDLLAQLPLGDVPSALTLPFGLRGMTAARLLMVRALRWRWADQASLYLAGVPRLVADATASYLGDDPEPGGLSQLQRDVQWSYTRPLDADDPVVRLVGATVSLAAREGVRVLVIASPVSREVQGDYSPEGYAARVAVVGDAVTAHGGKFLDLHAALPEAQFADNQGHFTPEGHATMLRLTTPAVGHELVAAGVWDSATRPAR